MGMPPPTRPNTFATFNRVIEGYETTKEWGYPVYTTNRTTTDTIGHSGKSPNSFSPKPKGGWLPCKAYNRFSSRYSPSGYVYGEQVFLGSLEWQVRTIPLGLLPSVTYLGTDVNVPFTDQGQHPWMDSNTETRLITECLIKVQGRKASYGEALAESRKTVNHLAETVTRLCNIFLGLKRRDPKLLAKGLGLGGKRHRGLLSRGWLEYQYAWMPLMSDVYDTYGLLTKGFGERPQLIRAVRKLSSTSNVDYVTRSNSIKVTGDVSIDDRCILFYNVDPSTLTKLGQLGMINPLEVIWAITPYSFVIDWFVPVGNLLQALTAPVGMTFVDGCLSRSARGSRTLEILKSSVRYPYKKDRSTYKCISVHEHFSRKAISAPPLPGLYFKNPFSTNHAASAAALVAQLLRR